MATVNKNFVIKNGLVVQGSTATINGNSILTQNAGDAYILNLVGGATLVKSVDSVFTVDQAGNLTLNYGTGLTKTSNNLVIDRSTVDTWYDASGSAASAQSAAESYADSQISSAITTLGNQTSTDISNAITTAENYTDAAISQEVTDRNNAISSALTTAENYADTAASNAQSAAENYTDNSITSHNNNTSGVHGVTGNVVGTTDSQTISNKTLGTDLAAGGHKVSGLAAPTANADAATKLYVDTAISDLIDGAPALLDTLNELAAAIADNPNYATDISTSLGEKVAKAGDSMTGNLDFGGTNKVTSLASPSSNGDAANKLYVDNTAASAQSAAESYANNAASNAQAAAESYADGVASTAQTNAQNYADSLAVNYDAAGSAATAQSNSNSYTDTAISNGNSSATPTYAGINFGWVAKDFAHYQWIANDSQTTVATWPLNYATAKLTVHLRNGNHSQASEVLIARDSSNNIHMTEYAVVTTNGSLGDITAIVLGSDILLKVTPTYATGTDVAVKGSSVLWAD